MDNIAESLTSYTASMKYEAISPGVVHKIKGLLVDTIACGLGGYASKPAEIARSLAAQVKQCDLPATILGTARKSTPELATFANGVMMRYLDFNDVYFGKGACHPSDSFAPVLTCADAVHANGKEVILASVVAYEVFCRLFDQLSLNNRGFDHATIGVIPCVLGTSKIFGLSREQTMEALNIALASSITLGQARAGELSMWKGCTMANAARNAVFATLLAQKRMTGPSPIFEGRNGFSKVVSGPIQLAEFNGWGKPFRLIKVIIKRYPCGAHAQTAVDAAIKLHPYLNSVNNIAEINIGVCAAAKAMMAGDAKKWHPRTRESADHSLPYVVAVALVQGGLGLEHFSKKYLNDPELLYLLQKTKVEETEECNRFYPETSASRVEIVTKSGERFSELVAYHRGHYLNPLTDGEIDEKFHSLVNGLLTLARSKRLLTLLWNLEQQEDVHKILTLTKVISEQNSG